MVYVEHMLQEKARDLVAKKTMEFGICGPMDTAAESEIHNAVWKELMEGETPRRPLNYGIRVTKSQITKLNDDLRRMRKRSSSPALEAKISFKDNQIKSMENTIKDLQSQIHLVYAAFGLSGTAVAYPNMDPLLSENYHLHQSQVKYYLSILLIRDSYLIVFSSLLINLPWDGLSLPPYSSHFWWIIVA